MKRHFYLICFIGLVISTQTFAQSNSSINGNVSNSIAQEPLPIISADSSIDKLLTTLQKSTGNDQVFVHLDRNMYKPGDTIYFQAYVRDQFKGSFESKSSSMYALLFNANKMMADSARFKIFDSTASGWMAIPEKAEPGKYHFAAFTGPMQNYDPANAFQLDILVTERSNPGKIEITFNKEKYNPGDTLVASVRITDPMGNAIGKQKFKGSLSSDTIFIESDETQTNKFGQSQIRLTLPDSIKSQPRFQITTKQDADKAPLIKEVSIPYDDPYFELRFLPEGGPFIEGIRQKVGFNATNFKGQPEQIEGLLKDSSGAILDSIKSGNYGPGYFSCMAKPGLYVELTKGSATEKIWPLPVPANNGISLSVNPIGNKSFAVEIRSNSYNSNPVTVSCIMNSTQVFLKTLILDKQKRIVFGTEEFPSGVAQMTLFDKDLKPLAQRLIYVNADNHLNFSIKTDSIHKPEGQTELTISVTDDLGKPVEGIFSIAVTDSLQGIDSELFAPGIEYVFNYHPHLAGNLPSKVLVQGLENLTDEERDLLFMVYGWSKINWDFSPKKADNQQLANYDLLNMKVLYAWKNHRADRKLDLISLEGPSITHLTTDDKGEISLPLDSLTDITRSVTLMPVVKDKSSAQGAMLSIPYNEQYFKSNKLFISQPTIPSDEYKVYPSYQYIPLDEKSIELKEFTIKGHQREKRVYQNEYEERYLNSNIRSLAPVELRTSFSLRDALNRLHVYGPIGVKKSPLIVLDGLPLYVPGGGSSWDMVSSLLPDEISSLSVLKGKGGFIRYGEAAFYGVVFINTFARNPSLMDVRTKWVQQNQNDKMAIPIDIYRPTIEFYNPTKLGDDIDPIVQNRATVFWEPEVYFDGKEPVKISYTNLKRRGPVSITINGVSFTDLMGTGKARYLVQ